MTQEALRTLYAILTIVLTLTTVILAAVTVAKIKRQKEFSLAPVLTAAYGLFIAILLLAHSMLKQYTEKNRLTEGDYASVEALLRTVPETFYISPADTAAITGAAVSAVRNRYDEKADLTVKETSLKNPTAEKNAASIRMDRANDRRASAKDGDPRDALREFTFESAVKRAAEHCEYSRNLQLWKVNLSAGRKTYRCYVTWDTKEKKAQEILAI